MPTYGDRLTQTYGRIGEAKFWLKRRRRITEGLAGQLSTNQAVTMA